MNFGGDMRVFVGDVCQACTHPPTLLRLATFKDTQFSTVRSVGKALHLSAQHEIPLDKALSSLANFLCDPAHDKECLHKFGGIRGALAAALNANPLDRDSALNLGALLKKDPWLLTHRTLPSILLSIFRSPDLNSIEVLGVIEFLKERVSEVTLKGVSRRAQARFAKDFLAVVDRCEVEDFDGPYAFLGRLTPQRHLDLFLFVSRFPQILRHADDPGSLLSHLCAALGADETRAASLQRDRELRKIAHSLLNALGYKQAGKYLGAQVNSDLRFSNNERVTKGFGVFLANLLYRASDKVRQGFSDPCEELSDPEVELLLAFFEQPAEMQGRRRLVENLPGIYSILERHLAKLSDKLTDKTESSSIPSDQRAEFIATAKSRLELINSSVMGA